MNRTVKQSLYLVAMTVGITIGFLINNAQKPTPNANYVGDNPASAIVKIVTQNEGYKGKIPETVFMVMEFNSIDSDTLLHLKSAKGQPVRIRFER